MKENAPARLAQPRTTATLGKRRSAVRSANGTAAEIARAVIHGIFEMEEIL